MKSSMESVKHFYRYCPISLHDLKSGHDYFGAILPIKKVDGELGGVIKAYRAALCFVQTTIGISILIW